MMIFPDKAVKYLVIGHPVGHSRSPRMQNEAFRFHRLGEPYGALDVPPEELGTFAEFARGNLLGVNVTVPHKGAIMEFVDEIEPTARAAGSVNTLKIVDGRICGFSTDGYGMEKALESAFRRPISGAKLLFVGCGGAARATAFHLAGRGADKIWLFNRTKERADALADGLRRHLPGRDFESFSLADTDALERAVGEADILIQATKLGLADDDPAPFPLELLEKSRHRPAIFDTIYRDTPLLRRAAELGIPAAGGAEMLIHQGARSFEIWTGLKAPVDEMRRGFYGG